jgi:hypothetical protein
MSARRTTVGTIFFTWLVVQSVCGTTRASAQDSDEADVPALVKVILSQASAYEKGGACEKLGGIGSVNEDALNALVRHF